MTVFSVDCYRNYKNVMEKYMNFIRRIMNGLLGKLLILAAIPFAAFLVVSGLTVYEFITSLSVAKYTREVHHVVEHASELIEELQRERGKSVAYTVNNLSQSELDSQRSATDVIRKELKENLEALDMDKKIREHAFEHLNEIEGHRSLVNEKATRTKIIAGYNDSIQEIMNLQLEIGRATHDLDDIMRVSVLESARESLGRLRATFTPILATDKPISNEDVLMITDLRAGADMALNAPILTTEKTVLEKIESFKSGSEWARVNEIYKKIAERSRTGKFEEDPKAVFAMMTQAVDRIGGIIKNSFEQAKISNEEERAELKKRLIYLLITAVISVMVIAAILMLVIRLITKPIRKIIDELLEGSINVKSTSGQLSNAAGQLSATTTETAASLEETVSSLEILSAMVRTTTDNSVQATELTKVSQDTSEKGDAQLQLLISAMNELETRSKQIAEIINVIDDIAFQTNLLALNAAVEAARAGEQGKGFAVVAEAVRNLAGKSATSAKEINTLIKDSVEKTDQGAAMANQSGAALKEIVLSFSKVTTLIEEIAKASREQQSGIEQINKAMNQIDQATQSNAATAEEASASASEMNNQAALLQDTIAKLAAVIDGAAK